MAEEQGGDRHGGIHADRDLTIQGEGHRVAGRDVIEAETYIANALVQLQSPPEAPLGLLPADVADFTGRESEVAKLEGELLGAQGQAVVISAVAGKPGVGKSALAMHVAHRLAEHFPDGQVYVDLRGADQRPLSPETALTELLHVLGVPADQQPTSLDGKAALWRQRLAGRRVLVVVDNAHDEGQVRPLLPGSRTCAVLVTSRMVLATLGARPLLLDTFDSGEALELLGKLAGTERIEADQQAALAVVAVCGGLPLAVRIAGAKLLARPDWPIGRMATRLADEHRRLAELGLGDLDVRATFQLSYQDLDREQARLFRLLGLWPGPDFHPWVAAALLHADQDAAEALVDELVASQLVEPAAVSGRFRVHDLLRLFAREHLDRDPAIDQETATERLLEVAIGLASISQAALLPVGLRQDQGANGRVDSEAALRWLEAERNGLVDLIGQAAERGPWPAAWQLADRLDGFLALRGYWTDQERIHRCALQAARQADDRAAEARALGNLGFVLARRGHWQQAIGNYEYTMAVMRELGDRRGEAIAVNNLGNVLRNQGHWQQATEHFQLALTIYRELSDRHGEAQALGNLGFAVGNQGHWQQATEHLQQSLTMFRELGDRHGEGRNLTNLGNVLVGQGRWQEAAEYYQLDLAICQELGDRHGEAQTLGSLGTVFGNQGHWQQAIDYFQQALTVFRELGDRHGEGRTLDNLGLAFARQGHGQQAEEHWRAALVILQELGAPEAEGIPQFVRHQRGDLEEAEQWRRRAAAAGDHDAENNLGMLLKDRGDLEGAEQWWRRAAESGHHSAEFHLGLLLKDRGDLEEAEQWWRRAAAAGDHYAEYNLGMLLHQRGDLEEAEQWWRKAAAAGDHEAENNVGVLWHEQGRLAEAETWYRKAANAGHHRAEFNLGMLLAQEKRTDEAEQWYRKAADGNDTEIAAQAQRAARELRQ